MIMQNHKFILAGIVLTTLLAPSVTQARRHFDPKHGRWLQRDPTHYVDGMNLYEYAQSNPIVKFDPYGLASLAVSVIKDDIYLAIGTRINVKTPKSKCGSTCKKVKWMQFLVYEKWVTFNPLSESPDVNIASWVRDGNPWYTKDVSGPVTSSNWETWTFEDQPGTNIWTHWKTFEVTQDFETCAVCFDRNGKACTIGCARWGHYGAITFNGRVQTFYGNGSQRLQPSSKMLSEIRANVGGTYSGMCRF